MTQIIFKVFRILRSFTMIVGPFLKLSVRGMRWFDQIKSIMWICSIECHILPSYIQTTKRWFFVNFNKHSEFLGMHAFLGASKYHWLNYDTEKLAATWHNQNAAAH